MAVSSLGVANEDDLHEGITSHIHDGTMACIYFLDGFVIPSGSEGIFLAFMRSLYALWAVSQLAV